MIFVKPKLTICNDTHYKLHRVPYLILACAHTQQQKRLAHSLYRVFQKSGHPFFCDQWPHYLTNISCYKVNSENWFKIGMHLPQLIPQTLWCLLLSLSILNPIYTADATLLSSWVASAVTRCVRNSQLVGHSLDESKQQRVELRRVVGVNASVGSRHELVACELCSHRRRDSTRQLRRVGAVYWALCYLDVARVVQ